MLQMEIIIIFILIGSPGLVNSKSQKYRLQFDINSLPEEEQVKAAEVRFTMLYNEKSQDTESIHLFIHDIVQPGIKGLSKPILR